MDTTTSELPEDVPIAVFDDFIQPPIEVAEWATPDEMIAHHKSLRESAIAKLANLGLTEEEAKIVIGV